MKKRIKFLSIILFGVLMFGMMPNVHAADYATGEDEEWSDFVNKVCTSWEGTKILPDETYTCSLKNSTTLEMSYISNFYNEDTHSVEPYTEHTEISYSNGIIEVVSDTYGNFGDMRPYAVNLVIENAVPNFDSESWSSFIFDNLENHFNINNDGIEFSGKMFGDTEEGKQLNEELKEQYDQCVLEHAGEPEKIGEYCIGWGYADYVVYDTLKINLKNGVKAYEDYKLTGCINCGDGDEEYPILAGSEQKFDVAKDKNLTFRIDADYNLFDKVYIDDKEVDSSNYKVTSGSTIITFNDKYTKTLKTGSHELYVSFTDGKSSYATFTISNNIVENPNTAVKSLYPTIIVFVAVTLIAGASYYKLRKQNKFPQV